MSESYRIYYENQKLPTEEPGVEISLQKDIVWENRNSQCEQWKALSVFACQQGLVLELAKQMKENSSAEFQIVMGYRDANTFLKEEFEAWGETIVATEDGSVGTKGNVLDAIRENGLTADVIYACGPTPMLRALKAYAAEQGMDCYISMEERMACGIGACLACVCKSKEKDEHSNVKNKRICKEGPVFDAKEVEL